MDHTDKAMDYLEDAMSDLRASKRAGSADLRSRAIFGATASVNRALAEMDKIASDILETEAANS